MIGSSGRDGVLAATDQIAALEGWLLAKEDAQPVRRAMPPDGLLGPAATRCQSRCGRNHRPSVSASLTERLPITPSGPSNETTGVRAVGVDAPERAHAVAPIFVATGIMSRSSLHGIETQSYPRNAAPPNGRP